MLKTLILGVEFISYDYRYHGKKKIVEKIRHKNRDSNGRCGNINNSYLTAHHYLDLFVFISQTLVTVETVPPSFVPVPFVYPDCLIR